MKDQVEAWMSEISPGIKIFIVSNEDIDSNSLQYCFENKNHNSKKYNSTNVGFGISSTLPIVVALLASPPGSLMIIEHPEGHLHPSGSTKIGKLIALAASSGIQVIIETHSDHILNGIRVSVHGGLINEVAESQKAALALPELRCTFGGATVVPDVAVFRWGTHTPNWVWKNCQPL